MQFAGIDNAFGTDAFAPVVATPPKTLYYKGLRLGAIPVRVPRAPKPLSHHLRNFLLNYDK